MSSLSDADSMTTIQMMFPPRFSLVVFAILTVIWSQQHPVKSYAETRWILPIETPAKLVGTYQAPATAYSAGHRGLDYQVKDGQKLMAPSDGEVRFSGLVAEKPVVSLIHSGGYITSFEPACSSLKKGERVKIGQVIGQVCALGYRSHCHVLCLHYGMRIGENYLSPLALAGALAPSHTVSQARG